MIDLPKLITPPETFVVTTGGDEERLIVEERDAFFNRVRQALGLAATRCDVFFRVHSYQQNYSEHQATDDRLHLLSYAGRQPVASVLDWRNDFNNHVVSFGVYPLTLLTQESIAELAAHTAALERGDQLPPMAQ